MFNPMKLLLFVHKCQSIGMHHMLIDPILLFLDFIICSSVVLKCPFNAAADSVLGAQTTFVEFLSV